MSQQRASGPPVVITESLGGSPLARAAVSGDPRVAAWYDPRPRGVRAWRERLQAVAAGVDEQWTRRLLPAFGDGLSGTAAGERLHRAAAVVTTGQQPGLFGGPVYTWSKALSALALADVLERETGVPVAPVFWAATDDADFAESASTFVALRGGARALRVGSRAPEGTPLSAVPLGDDVRDALEVLAEACGSAANPAPLDAARAAYVPGRTVGDAYLALLRALLEPLGVAVLDASHPATRAAADATLRDALRRGREVDAALVERTRALRDAGFEPQVAPVPGLSLVFDVQSGVKRRVPIAEAPAAAELVPAGSLAPNVLLRPVVERAILPTAAYLAGPGEIAYFAQVSAVADVLGAARPLVLPRWSGTIIEPHVARLLARHGLVPADVADPHAAESRLARRELPPAVAESLDALRAAIARETEALRADGDRGSAPILPHPVIEGARRALAHRVDRLERRAVAAVKRAGSEALRDVATARGALYPNGARQERALNLLPLLARHGPPLVAAMRERAGAHAATLVTGEQGSETPSAPEEATGGVAAR